MKPSYLLRLPYYIWCAMCAIVEYLIDMYVRGVPISYPGDARKKQLTRLGKWSKETKKTKSSWKFAESAHSHEVTNKDFPKYPLTGETEGRQTWYKDNDLNEEEFEFNAAKNPNSGDKLFRKFMMDKWHGPLPKSGKAETAVEAVDKAIAFYQMIQCDDGHWAGDYGGPMFLMPGLVVVLYLTKSLGTAFPQYKMNEMIRYLRNHQQVDGGWGTHIECASTMFGTILNYVALRLLGVCADEEFMVNARNFIHKYGGALYAPSWAKFWLACLGVYDWVGINSIPCEMWLLPRWFPFHPGKLWCHCRMVYLPMCYLYCKRYVPEMNELLLSLRKELYVENYDTIDWDETRQLCADIDAYSPLNPVMKLAQDFLSIYERVVSIIPGLQTLRRWGLEFAIKYIHAEDIQTNYVDIGPVNKSLNMLCVWVEGNGDSSAEAFQRHLARVDDYLWVAEDGMKMQGYNGSQCWDTTFAIQAILESGMSTSYAECVEKAYKYIKDSQIQKDEDNRDYWFRHISKGGWPFSSSAHGWPISDCTAEGLKSVLFCHRLQNQLKASGATGLGINSMVSSDMVKCACDVLLSFHNKDGGWATYENNRGSRWYEMLNPSEVFGDIMIDYSYVECSSASLTALKSFSISYPEYRPAEVQNAIKGGVSFIKSIQRSDGSWYGSWGNCFMYGTWFGVEGLIGGGEEKDSYHVRKAVEFILSKQNPNGGWGESYLACVNKAYPFDGTGELGEDGSGVVQTAWALLALMAADCADVAAIERGIKFLIKRQCDNGDWEQEGITGVFNRSCGITYTAYRNVFPLWALGRYARKYER